ncbi:outer membrane beta-barrel protein [Fibrella aquatilis]|uniref:Outer membrane beta-barrel protein n=1 Tax=Fibrella aquatilis TaxID=2817059 RepID=A0A939GD87_9BACT|nr:outer membrane beta-barrel protein [Fibrella aquatilis]MBO0934710.1 outer membrane beta-barrel protein [Fibrella aquatilis]
MNKKSYILAGFLLASGAATAQLPTRLTEFGLKGGVTFVHGYTTIPAQPTSIVGVQVPQLENKNNGIGTGYSAGAFVRFNKYNRKGYVQIELTYNRYLLKQKTNVTLDVNANPALAARLPLSFAPGLLNATVDVTSESSIESFDIPVLFGRRLLNNKLRAYIGPTLLFVNKSEAMRSTQGQINPNTAIGFSQAVPIPATTETTNLLSPREASNLQVKRVTWALEAGLGISPLPFLDVDIRYAVPAGGVYKDTNIKGYLGIATLTAGIKLP